MDRGMGGVTVDRFGGVLRESVCVLYLSLALHRASPSPPPAPFHANTSRLGTPGAHNASIEADDATHSSGVQIQPPRAVDVCADHRWVRARAIPVLWGPRGPRVAARLRLQRARSAF